METTDKPLTRDDFVIDAVSYQGKTRYSLQSKYQSFKREDIVRIIDIILRSQRLDSIKSMVDSIDVDKIEKEVMDSSYKVQEMFTSIRKLKREI